MDVGNLVVTLEARTTAFTGAVDRAIAGLDKIGATAERMASIADSAVARIEAALNGIAPAATTSADAASGALRAVGQAADASAAQVAMLKGQLTDAMALKAQGVKSPALDAAISDYQAQITALQAPAVGVAAASTGAGAAGAALPVITDPAAVTAALSRGEFVNMGSSMTLGPLVAQAASAQSALTRLGDAATTLGSRFSAAGKRLSSFGQQASDLGGKLSMGLSLPLVAIGGYTVYAASKFQSAMEQIRTQAGASQQEVDQMSRAILAMGGTVSQGPQALASALFHLESIGLRGSSALRALRAASMGAAMGGANLEDVTNAVGAAMVSQIQGAQNATATMATLNAIVGAGNMRMQDLASSMASGVLPAAQSAGLSLLDVGAALATLTDAGVPAADAATRLRMTFSLLSAPTKQATKELASIGISQLQLAADMHQQSGLMVALTDLKTHLTDAGLTAEQQGEIIARAFGGGRSSSAIITLIDNLGRLQSKYQSIDATVSQFGSDFQATTQTMSYQFGLFGSKVQSVAIQMGAQLAPAAKNLVDNVLTPMLDRIQSLVTWFSNLAPQQQTSIEKWAMYAIVAGPALYITGALAGALGSVFKLLGGGIGIIGNAIGWFGKFATAVREVGFAEAFMDALNPAGWVAIAAAALAAGAALILTHWASVSAFFAGTWAAVKSAFQDGIAVIDSVVHLWVDQWTAQWDAIKYAVDEAVVGVLDVLRPLTDVLPQSWRATFDRLNSAAHSALGGTKGDFQNLAASVEQNALTISGSVQGVGSAFDQAYQQQLRAVEYARASKTVTDSQTASYADLLKSLTDTNAATQALTASNDIGTAATTAATAAANALGDGTAALTAKQKALAEQIPPTVVTLDQQAAASQNTAAAARAATAATETQIAALSRLSAAERAAVVGGVNGTPLTGQQISDIQTGGGAHAATPLTAWQKAFLATGGNTSFGGFTWVNGVLQALGKTGSAAQQVASAMGLPKFGAGGVVPGSAGMPALALVHGGETVLPPSSGGSAAVGAQDVHVHVEVDGHEIAETVFRYLPRVAQRYGIAT